MNPSFRLPLSLRGLLRPLALAGALALPMLAAPPMIAPAQAQVQNPNVTYVQRQQGQMKITNLLWYSAHAGAYATRLSLQAADGDYSCTIDGRNARLSITTEVFVRSPRESCYAGGPDCNVSGATYQTNVQFQDMGWNNNRNAPWVTMRLNGAGASRLIMTHPNSPQPWELTATAWQRVLPGSDPRWSRLGPFSTIEFPTTFTGHTVWEGRRYPLSCTRIDMQTLRNIVPARWAP